MANQSRARCKLRNLGARGRITEKEGEKTVPQGSCNRRSVKERRERSPWRLKNSRHRGCDPAADADDHHSLM